MSTKNSNKLNVPEAKAAMDQFKMEAASEVGVNLKNGYNGHLTSREAGSVGGQMVKNKCPIRTMEFVRNDRTAFGHKQEIKYIASITVLPKNMHAKSKRVILCVITVGILLLGVMPGFYQTSSRLNQLRFAASWEYGIIKRDSA